MLDEMADKSPEEIWREIPGLNRYQVSSLGRVIGPHGKILKGKKCKSGYRYFSINQGNGVITNVSVARSVCAAFNGECPEGHECDHINRVRDDDRPENLRWLTKSQNLKNRSIHSGTSHWNSKLKPPDIKEIRSVEMAHLNNVEMARIFNVARETIRDIRNYKEWKHVS